MHVSVLCVNKKKCNNNKTALKNSLATNENDSFVFEPIDLNLAFKTFILIICLES